MGFIRPTSGRITIAGENVRSALRKNLVSYVPQTEEVDWNFPVLVEDVVMMGRVGQIGLFRWPGRKDWALVRDSLARVNAGHLAKSSLAVVAGRFF